jgi:DNA modification methylase
VNPYYEADGITIYHGKAEDVAPLLSYDVVVTDPPWGIDVATNSQRFTRNSSPWWDNVDNSKVRTQDKVIGDDKEFDPRPWIDKPAIIWGANHFTRHLPHSGGWLIWDKRKGAEDMAEKGWPLGEAELAWTNVRGSTRVFRNLWSGLLRQAEKGEFYHPTQKPVSLMEWCMQFVPEGVVIDPYMGSGSTLVGAQLAGRRAIGIEIEERYCEIAVQRLAQGVLEFS